MIKIYSDGACLANPGGPGGWSFCVEEHDAITITDKTIFFSGGVNYTTNNRMELTAILEALTWCKDNKRSNVTIYSDSKYCVKGINTWMHKWISKNWDGVANVDLFKNIYNLSKIVKVHMEWVRGHDGNVFNEFVDGQAEKMAIKYLESQVAKYSTVEIGNKVSMPIEGSKWHGHFKVAAKFESSGTLILSPVRKGKTQIVSAEDFDNGNHILIG